jgi:hypothetical protein
MHREKLTLATICGGAVQEKVDRALERVAENILDPNTDPRKKRSITLKITFKPDESDNEDVEVDADVHYTLAPEVGVQTRFFVNKDLHTDRISVMEHKKGEIRGQLDFSDMDEYGIPPVDEDIDPTTGEINDEVAEGSVLDFRRKV